MTLQQMIDFCTVAQHGSLHAAARTSGQTQPALSKSLRRLEEHLGAQLVTRSAKGLRLTDYGTRFLPHAQLVVAEARRAKEAVGQLLGEQLGHVHYGISTAASILLAPAAVERFRQRFAQVQLRSHGGLYDTLTPLLREGLLDFAICPMPGDMPVGEFATTLLLNSDMALVARPGHPDARARSLRRLQHARFVVGAARGRPGAGIYDAFEAAGLGTPFVQVQTDSPLDTLAMVAATDCLCLVPAELLRHGFFQGAVVALAIEDALPVYRVGLFRRHDSPLTPAAQALAAHFEHEAALLPRRKQR
ncbi:LysR substrate-binding domain-containing protein [Piscinibacter sp.]|uniref:LysR substrate-binding domain-containing protein n=1 Tax=Piscinibacter sp. TaxID=1903157 RepID=UPI002BFE486B|nr:LysR substrate-binding domain-containing protein [Albitalea sp.]HUG21405.1 LysR substrate-binding domain-containing protein [Albitalea sp.]